MRNYIGKSGLWRITLILKTCLVYLHSPTNLVVETCFMEDIFSTNWGMACGWFKCITVIMCFIYIIIMCDKAVMQALQRGCKYRWHFIHSLTAYLLLRDLVPTGHRLVPIHGLGTGDPCCKWLKLKWTLEITQYISFFFNLWGNRCLTRSSLTP